MSATPELFNDLPAFPAALPDDDLRLLARLPDWGTTVEIKDEERAAARRLEGRGLIKIQRWKSDPIAIRPEWWAGKLPAAKLSTVSGLQSSTPSGDKA